MNDSKQPWYIVGFFVVGILWFSQGLIINFWGFVQSTLISQSQLAQNAQQLSQRLAEKEKELQAAAAKVKAEEATKPKADEKK